MKFNRFLCQFYILLINCYLCKYVSSYGEFEEHSDRCTTIGLGPKATVDGSTITTHNNDCGECDIRVTHVPAMDWPKGSKRPIFKNKDSYPRYVENVVHSNLSIHGPDYSMDKLDFTIFDWKASEPIAFIDQVEHTYAYTLGTYAIQNEKQVSIGESTCSAIFVGKPIYDGGHATFCMETLTEIALERCANARCAIQTMGNLAVAHGFYGPEWNSDIIAAQDEAGEALIISDVSETWVFHILPDCTGTSAIWVAKKVPDGHIAAVANQFTIGYVDVTDGHNYMSSPNLLVEAVKHDAWIPASGQPFNFAKAFGNNRHQTAFACTRRIWRIYTLAAPSLLPIFKGYSDGFAEIGYGEDLREPYPFSVKPDRLLSIYDVMNMTRDQFEGTEFDLTKGLDAGMFGDPMRFVPRGAKSDPIEGINLYQYSHGLGWQRPISLWRTAYASITQSRKHLPDAIGAVTWIAQYAPHFSSFVPVYANADATPSSLKAGTQYKLDKNSNWWIHCLTGNYLSRWYVHTIDEIKHFQRKIENDIAQSIASIEIEALRIYSKSNSLEQPRQTINLLTLFSEETAVNVRDQWWEFFFMVAGKYRDIYKVVDIHSEEFINAYTLLTVPRSFLEWSGFWGPPGTPAPGNSEPLPVKPINVPSEDSLEDYEIKYPNGLPFTYSWPYSYVSTKQSIEQIINDKNYNRWIDISIGLVIGIISTCIVIVLMNYKNKYRKPINYQNIQYMEI